MGEKILGYSFDYEESARGRLLVIGEEQIPADQLIDAGVKMLESHDIPNVMPLSVEFTNFKAKLSYSLKGKKFLSDVLRGKKLSISEYVKILRQIIVTINESPRYFLNEENFILELQYIFSSPDYEIGMLYLPIQDLTKKDTVFNEIKNNIVTVIYAQVRDQDTIKAKAVLEDFLSGELTLLEIGEHLEKMDKDPQPVQAPPLKQVETPKPQVNNPASLPSVQKGSPVPPKASEKKPNLIPKQPDPVKDNTKNDKKAAKQDTPVAAVENTGERRPLNSKERTLVMAVGAVLVAFYWAVFALYRSINAEGFLYLALGLSIITGDVIFAILKFSQKSDKKVSKKAASHSKKAQAKAQAQAAVAIEVPAVPVHNPAPPAEPTNYTVPLDSGTVLLSEAYLVVTSSEGQERINLNHLPLLIGRNKQLGSYNVSDSAISSNHARIEQIQGNYIIKDIGSTNGTKINGAKLESNQAYPLNEGDMIRMGRTDFLFHVGY